MKYILTFLAVLICVCCQAQKQDTIIFEGASKIIIKNVNAAKDNFILAGKALIDNGYFIASKDGEFNQIVSDAFPIEGNAFRRGLVFYVVSRDNEIIITARTRRINASVVPGADQHAVNEPISYTKKLELSRVVFSRAIAYAKTLIGSIYFSE